MNPMITDSVGAMDTAAVDTPEFLFPLDARLDARRFLPIKYWEVQDRPREKFLSGKMQEMSNEELLAILIGSGNGLLSAVDSPKKYSPTSGAILWN